MKTLNSTDPTVQWLLQSDQPGVRYLTLTRLLDMPGSDHEVGVARAAIYERGPVAELLARQNADGTWGDPSADVAIRYRITLWQLTALAQWGAGPGDERIHRAAEFVLEHGQSERGDFPPRSGPYLKSSPNDVFCLDAMIIATLLRLCDQSDPRLQRSAHFVASTLAGVRSSGNPMAAAHEPLQCKFNEGRPCGWAGVKALCALAAIPNAERSLEVRRAIEIGVECLLNSALPDPGLVDQDSAKVSEDWVKLTYPYGLHSSYLEALETLAELGCARDARLRPVMDYVFGKVGSQGRWPLEATAPGLLVSDETVGGPSKWVTLKALLAVRAAVI